MLVVEKVFGIKLKDDSKKEDLCRSLSTNCCFDKTNYKLDNQRECIICEFFDEHKDCCPKVYNWLLSEYKEGSDANV